MHFSLKSFRCSPRSTGLWGIGLLSLLLVACSSGDVDEKATLEPNSERQLTYGRVVGSATANDGHVWYGVPYAAPPVGDFRWSGARLLRAQWEGVREHLIKPSACAQIGGALGGTPEEFIGKVYGSEDCLYMNVYSPNMSADEALLAKLPVMVWIHGGGNVVGNASIYDFSRLAVENQVVVVAVQYRLGPFGFFAHPALREVHAGRALDLSPNQGILDLLVSLFWVKENINGFGGNPERITIFGESAGGRNVMALVASPAGHQLFQGAISQSGLDLSGSPKDAENYADQLDDPGHRVSSKEQVLNWILEAGLAEDRGRAKRYQDESTPGELVQWMRSRDVETILRHYFGDGQGGPPDYPPRLLSDFGIFGEAFSLNQALESAKTAGQNNIPIIFGFNRDETKLFTALDPALVETSFFGLRREILDPDHYDAATSYPSRLWGVKAAWRPARALRDAGRKVWVYRFDWDEEPTLLGADYGEIFGAAHALEIPFVTGDWDFASLSVMFDSDNEEGREILGKQIRSYWANFAATGNPNGADADPQDAGHWAIFDSREEHLVLDTGDDLRVARGGESTDHIVAQLLIEPRLSVAEKCRMIRDEFDVEIPAEAIGEMPLACR